MRLRVGEGERTAPGAAEHQPALDAELLAQLLDVVDQVPGGVVFEAGVGRALAAAALVQQNDAVMRWIEVAAMPGCGAATGSAMHEQCWRALRIAALLMMQL